MSDNYKDKADYVTAEDCKELHTEAQQMAAKQHDKWSKGIYKYIPHPELPQTWIMRKVGDSPINEQERPKKPRKTAKGKTPHNYHKPRQKEAQNEK